MSLKKRMQDKAPSLVRKETITLPDMGESVVVRGLMFGKSREIGQAGDAKRATLMVANATEDPETGELVWDVDDKEDMAFIETLTLTDVIAITEKCEELSGARKPKKKESSDAKPPPNSTQTATSNSPISLLSEESGDEA
jgi:hypothetical protein